jgi:hypothetical protein
MVWGIKKIDYLKQIYCCFSLSFVCFGCFETLKLPVSMFKRNNRNKRLVSDSAETSFGSSFGCFDSKLGSEDTLAVTYTVNPSVFVLLKLDFYFALRLVLCNTNCDEVCSRF